LGQIKEDAMATDDRDRPNLRDMDASDIRNRQRSPGGTDHPQPSDAEASHAMRDVWSNPGGEAYNYRNAMVGAGGKADDHSDLTAAETPETHRHLSDASLSPKPDAEANEAANTLGQPEGGSAGQAGRADAPERSR